MARPKKQGLDYFPLDTDLDLDDKLGMIIAEFDHKGEYAYTKLLCWIYRNDGYFTKWTEEVQLMFMRRYKYCGFSLNFIVKEIVPRCLKWGLFDQRLFDSFQILTSTRIQETWLEVSRKRTNRTYIQQYWLLGVNTGVLPEKTSLTPEVINKGNESKEKKIKENIVALDAPSIDNPALIITPAKEPPAKISSFTNKFVPPDVQEVKMFFLKVIGNPQNRGHWPIDKCEYQAGKFYNHYTANGWKQGMGKPIVDWQAAGRNWIANERAGIFSNSAVPAQRPMSTGEQKPELSKIEVEINYLYQRYREDPTKVTCISVDPLHYSHIKKAGLILFTDDIVNEIKREVMKYLADKKIPENDSIVSRFMKKFGVLYFFQEYSDKDKEAVFEIR